MFSSGDKDERSLIERCLRADNHAWETLQERHRPRIAGIVMWPKWKFERHEIDDVIQETWLQLVKSLKEFKFQSSLGTFIYTITEFTCIEQIRKKTAAKRDGLRVELDTVSADQDDPDIHIPRNPGPNPEDEILRSEQIGILKRGLASLDKKCKELVRLRFFEDVPFRDIAARLDEKPNTLIVQLKRCLLKIMKQFQTEGL